jgi:hypothetical protein
MTSPLNPRPSSYWSLARAHRYSLTFALPLLVLYELLAAALAGDPRAQGVRNGADVLLKSGFVAVAGQHGPTIFMALVVIAAVWLIWRDRRTTAAPMQPRIFAFMLGESLLLAMLLGIVVGTITAQLLGFAGLQTALAAQATSVEGMGIATRLMLSLGAGLYEELFFRVLLVAAIAKGAQLALGWKRKNAGILAVIVGALLFSAFHYIGAYGDPLELGSFTYRAIAGVVFSALYLTRGFGITAWTHALYDVMVMVV